MLNQIFSVIRKEKGKRGKLKKRGREIRILSYPGKKAFTRGEKKGFYACHGRERKKAEVLKEEDIERKDFLVPSIPLF